MALAGMELLRRREVGGPPGILRPDRARDRLALRQGLDADRLQQVLLRGHQAVPPGPLPGEPHPQVLALHDQLTRSGRERATGLDMGEGEPVRALPPDLPYRAP